MKKQLIAFMLSTATILSLRAMEEQKDRQHFDPNPPTFHLSPDLMEKAQENHEEFILTKKHLQQFPNVQQSDPSLVALIRGIVQEELDKRDNQKKEVTQEKKKKKAVL